MPALPNPGPNVLLRRGTDGVVPLVSAMADIDFYRYNGIWMARWWQTVQDVANALHPTR